LVGIETLDCSKYLFLIGFICLTAVGVWLAAGYRVGTF